MYNIKLDENNYYTGTYAKVGKVAGGIEIPSLPPDEDIAKQCSHYWNGTEWIFDEEKYNIVAEQNNIEVKKSEISRNITGIKTQLASTDYQVIKCQECQLLNLEMPYDLNKIRAERQALRDKINALEVKLENLNNI